MFEKRDYRVYKGVKRDKIYPQVCDFWSRQGFYVAQISPYQIQGESYHSNIGLRREFYLHMDEQNDSTFINVTFRARVTDTGAVGGVAAAVLFWPAAVVGGALSYTEYEKDANALLYNFWSYMDQVANQKGALPPGAAPPTHPPPPYTLPPQTPPPNQTQPQQPPANQEPKQKDQEQDPEKETTKESVDQPPEKLEEYNPPSEKSMQCSECGALLPKDWKACPYCGTHVD
jgi:hypothetical protein